MRFGSSSRSTMDWSALVVGHHGQPLIWAVPFGVTRGAERALLVVVAGVQGAERGGGPRAGRRCGAILFSVTRCAERALRAIRGGRAGGLVAAWRGVLWRHAARRARAPDRRNGRRWSRTPWWPGTSRGADVGGALRRHARIRAGVPGCRRSRPRSGAPWWFVTRAGRRCGAEFFGAARPARAVPRGRVCLPGRCIHSRRCSGAPSCSSPRRTARWGGRRRR